MSAPIVSVVIPVLDAGVMLLDCLRSLGAQDEDIEVILVDNASTDGIVTEACREFPRLRVVRNEENLGFAVAANQGLAATSAASVLFLNSDAVLTRVDLDELLRTAAGDPAAAIWQPVIQRPDGSIENAGEFFTITGFCIRSLDAHLGRTEPYPVFACTAACMLGRTDVLREAGGFTEGYFAYIEDVDLCWRIRLAGWEVHVVPNVIAHHVGGATTRRILSPDEKRYLTFRNRFRMILANASLSVLIRTIPLYVASCIATAVAIAVSGRFRSAYAIVRAVQWPLAHGEELRAERDLARKSRTVDDADLLRSDLVRRFFSRAGVRHFLAHYRA